MFFDIPKNRDGNDPFPSRDENEHLSREYFGIGQIWPNCPIPGNENPFPSRPGTRRDPVPALNLGVAVERGALRRKAAQFYLVFFRHLGFEKEDLTSTLPFFLSITVIGDVY